ncbi:MAG: hypothetical protein EZS28_037200 [Streblomastix strix]|uniref:Uncharacterized protein n=1 Tax=Streblomastix strix TaxID=222440 RepID=A0A5J4UAN2_9EUKA|nr:MAG: hypothetical protein EZS28_037200 [Streblomastix strix]
MEGENTELHGRHNFNPPIKATTQADDSGDHLLPFKSGLASLSYQMRDNTQEMLSVSRLEFPNVINGGNNDSDKKKKYEAQTERQYSNDKMELNCSNQKYCHINWRIQLSSIPVPTNISLDECDQQPQDQSHSQMGLQCIYQNLEADSEQPLDNSDINQIEQTTLNERQNSKFNINDRSERKWLRNDSGIQLRVNIGCRSMAGLMAPPIKKQRELAAELISLRFWKEKISR